MKSASPGRDRRTPTPRRADAEPPGQIKVAQVAEGALALFVRDHELTVDQPVEAGGGNDGPTPVELFVATLASCVASDAVRFLQLLDQPYERLCVQTHFALADCPAPRIAAIQIRILLPVPLTTVLEEGLQAVVGRCAVHNTLHVPPEVTVELG